MPRTIDAQERLRALVREHGSQKAVARYLGVSDPMVGDLLMGRRKFSDKMLAKIGLTRIVVLAKSA
jgi:DNA-binding transcriptional regulator YdaS (Cro superfamily)